MMRRSWRWKWRTYDLLAARELVRVEEKALELKSQFVSETAGECRSENPPAG